MTCQWLFLLAQHISESFQDLLVEQLDRCSQWPVALLGETQLVERGQVWLVPLGAVYRDGWQWRKSGELQIGLVICPETGY